MKFRREQKRRIGPFRDRVWGPNEKAEREVKRLENMTDSEWNQLFDKKEDERIRNLEDYDAPAKI
jgi:hypothetical protein